MCYDDKFYRFSEDYIRKNFVHEMGLDLAFGGWLRFGHSW